MSKLLTFDEVLVNECYYTIETIDTKAYLKELYNLSAENQYPAPVEEENKVYRKISNYLIADLDTGEIIDMTPGSYTNGESLDFDIKWNNLRCRKTIITSRLSQEDKEKLRNRLPSRIKLEIKEIIGSKQ